VSILVKISDLDLNNKTVLVREDYNVPIKEGVVVDDTRIVASLHTLKEISSSENTRIILVSHLGRPEEGKYDEAYTLQPVADCLSKHLGKPVPLIKDWIDGIDLTEHDIVLCENVRFEKGEKSNEDELARKMAALCNVYVNDAFATAHRAQASTHGIAKYVAVACAGPLLITELKSLSKALKDHARPVTAIVGGAKVSTKLELLESLIEKVDHLIVGGGIANTFLKAAGFPIGQSLYEEDLLTTAKTIIEQADNKNCTIPLPVDVVCAKEFSKEASGEIKSVDAVSEEDLILDVGPETTKTLCQLLSETKTIVWNGPLGVFEFDQFGEGTKTIANAIADSNAYSIAGGGDTLAAISKYQLADKISYISTGGGAFLEFLEGKKLPAVEILEEAARAWAAMERAREL